MREVKIGGLAPDVVTWSVAAVDAEAEASRFIVGQTGGWFPSVPRGELEGVVNALRNSIGNTRIVSDCQLIVNGFRNGVPKKLTSAASFLAELWRLGRHV